jgi:geranylgeranyl diphosphate synthase, type II
VAARDSFADFMQRARVQVDEALDRYLPSAPVCPLIVGEAMRYSVFAGGKRLRPILTLAAADAVATRQARSSRDAAAPLDAFRLALPAACAIELIHTYSLIHDDLPAMDNDSLRRGRPTLHTIYGDGIAILAGDGLHAEAFTLLAREPQPEGDDPTLAARKLRVIQTIGEAAGSSGMVGGQVIDLQAAGQVPGSRLTLDREGLRQMHSRKTGALIRASATCGAIMGGAPAEVVDAVDRYANDLGLAFQIVDDMLDVEGTPEELGKSTGKDAATGKPTYPALYGLEASRTLAAQCADRARATLTEAGLMSSHLPGIVEWVVSRRS